MTNPLDQKIGGPDAPYSREQNREVAPLTLLTPMRLARMLKLYVATHEGLTQKQVAQEAGISESTLSRFLSGEQMPDGRAFASLITWSFGEHKQALRAHERGAGIVDSEPNADAADKDVAQRAERINLKEPRGSK